MGDVKVQGHIIGLISYRLTSISSHVYQSPHTCDTGISNFELENQGRGQGQRSRSHIWSVYIRFDQ